MKYTVNILFILMCVVSYAQNLTSYKLSECDSDSFVELVRRRIVTKAIKDDTLTLKLGFIGNCCLSPKPTIHYLNDSIFMAIENVSDIFCACECCFEMELKVSNIKDTNFVLMWDNYTVTTQSKYPKLPHEYVIDEKTPINKLNSDSLKVGLWYKYIESSGNKYEIYYDPNPIKREIVLWTRAYDASGKLVYIEVSQGQNGDSIIFEPEEYERVFVK